MGNLLPLEDHSQSIVSDIRTRELADGLIYPKSGVKLKVFTGFLIQIDYRDHALGDSEALAPEFIKKHKYIVNFTKTNNKYLFNCLAYHVSNKKDSRKVQTQVKPAFTKYCEFKGFEHSISLYKNFTPIDLLDFDNLEKCFNLNINVYEETRAVENFRPADAQTRFSLDMFAPSPGMYSNLAEFVDSACDCFIKTKAKRLLTILKKVPVFGFNSGSYDINMIKNDLFEVLGDIDKVIKNGGYMTISTDDYKFLDKYVTTYLGGCKCVDSIRCVCGMTKGVFPYEYTTSYDVLNETELPPKSAFYSKYNNLDVAPFVLAIEKYRKEAKREFDMTKDHVAKIMKKQLCALCYCKLNEEIVSADRINNNLGHIGGNVMITCIACNVARKDMDIRAFRYKRLLDYNANRLVFFIDKKESDIYYKMNANIAGGPSIIFNRYAKCNETEIHGARAYDGIIDDIKADKISGFLECDVETPEHLKNYFSEMTPIFKNIEIEQTADVIGQYMYGYNQTRAKNKAKSGRKLIGSYIGKQILIYTPLLKCTFTRHKVSNEVIFSEALKCGIQSKDIDGLLKETTDAPFKSSQIYEAERRLEHKPSGKLKHIVKWKGYDEPTWESQDNLRLINKAKRSKLEEAYFRRLKRD
ncbi:hypothetical protein ON010_g4368 [Phytophthora cinnamomi]|nr:hypothetical protein ON010_g4368 [Phytophthora cinnamomi]